MRLLGDLSIRQKLAGIGVLSSMIALLSASAAFLAYDLYSFREAMARRLLTDAQIVGFNCISPVLFNDAETATSTLQGLRMERAVRAAVIRRPEDGRPFATYSRDGGAAPPLVAPASLAMGHLFTADHLLVSEPIVFEGRRIATLLIQAELHEIRDRQRRYLGILLLVLGGSFLLAIGISRVVARTISRPLLQLADTAQTVSSRKDYALRATAEGRDEVGRLVLTFNEMLDHIQEQNSELEKARLDLEERVEARTRDLASANKELEAFSYSVSHDLRAPLRAIDGFSKALLESYEGTLDDQGRHYLRRVRAGTQRMAELIDDLLALARVSRRELVRQRVDVSELACRVAAELSKRSPERPVHVEVEEGMTAEADPHLLTIVLENLIGNAWKFTGKRDDPCVEVGRRTSGPEPAFYVRDNGAGFDMAYAGRLFGAFQRLHDEADFEGTGIGLATVQRIVTRHGGRIWAEGQVGVGATFYFTLEH